MKKIIAILLINISLAGCGTIYSQDAVGVGYDPNELKVSPCACLKIEQKPGMQQWAYLKS